MGEITLCGIDDIRDGGACALEATVDGKRTALVAVRRGEQVWVYRNRCPHFSVPLDFNPGEFNTYRGQMLMCAHHSALFRFEDGLCIDGPCQGASLEPLEVRRQGGRVLLATD